MSGDVGDICERLRQVDGELADLALDSLRSAVADGATSRPPLERRITRARHALAKAIALLDGSEVAEAPG